MILKGKAYKVGDNVNTDLIISGRYKFAITDMDELAKHLLEDLNPDFYKKLTKGASILVAGEDFGSGSSREQASLAIKHAGILAVVAKSFARIFYRNAFNVGLPLVELNIDSIDEGDELEIDLEKGTLLCRSKDLELDFTPILELMRKVLEEGGLVNFYKKHGGF